MRLITPLIAIVVSCAACTGSGASPSANSTSTGAATAAVTAAPTTRATSAPASAVPTAAASAVPTAAATLAPATAAPSAAPTDAAAPTPTGPSGADFSRATWTKLRPADGPSPREDHTWTVDESGGLAYLFGGRAGGTLHDDLWVYDLAADTWTQIDAPGGPEARFGHEAVWLPGRGLVLFAGQAGPRFFNDLWLFDPASAAWTLLPAAGDLPVARYGSCSAVGPDGRLWISHGFTEDGVRFSDTRAYDFASGTWSDETPADGRRPVERCLHGCWFDAGGALVLYAGQTTGVTALGDLWRLSSPGVAGATWERLEGDLPDARNLYARAAAFGLLLVFGGRGNNGYLGDLWAFDPAGEGAPRSLAPTGDAPPPRSGAELIADSARGRLLLFGGKHDGGTFQELWQLVLE